jgi:Trk K+ transport system NAD-binding subunit
MILYSHRLYAWLAPSLGLFERRHPFRELAVEHTQRDGVRPDVAIFGLGRYGSRLAHSLLKQNIHVLGVDFDPEVVRAQQNQGLDARFGDGEAPDYVESLPLADVPWVVSTLPDRASNLALLNALAEHHYSGQIAIVARDEADADVASLRTLGRIEIILPFNQAADFAALDLAARIATAELNKDKETSS